MSKLRSGVPAAGTGDFRGLRFRFLVAIDVAGFSQRPAAEQARALDGLQWAMTGAAADAGLDRERWYRQSRGDGELALLPEGTDGLSLVADYPGKLASAIAEVNRERKIEPRLRVRMAIHHGAVVTGPFGPVGTAPVVISRLVDAESVRRLLSQRGDLDTALIVSDIVYKEVIQSRLHDLNPETFRRVIIKAKGITYAGYLNQAVALETQD
jgi:class 3 adenylate cyclase